MNNEELDALIARLKELEDPQKEAVPSFADTDWRTLSGVVAREIESLRQRNGDLVTGLEACDEQVVALRQQLDAAQADAKHAWEKAGEACTAHAASIKRELILLEFVQKIKKQTPEKPDYWSSCSQCEHNSNEGEDILEALAATSDLSGVILCHTKPVGEVGTIDTDDDGEPSAWVNLYNDVDLGEILYRAWEPKK